MNIIVSAKEAFDALQNGKTILCRYAGDGTLHGDADFSTLDQMPATVFGKPHYEFCIKAETTELAGITFTKPIGPHDLKDGQEIFIVMPTCILRTKFDADHADIRNSVMNGFAQCDAENALLQLQAFGALFGNVIENVEVKDGFVEDKPKRQRKSRENKITAIDTEIERTLQDPKTAFAPFYLKLEQATKRDEVDEIYKECEKLAANIPEYHLDLQDFIVKTDEKLFQLDQLSLPTGTGAGENTDPELSVLCDAFIAEIEQAKDGATLNNIKIRVNANGDLTEVEHAELSTRINLKISNLDYVTEFKADAAIEDKTQSADDKAVNDGGHYFDKVAKANAEWNEQMAILLEQLKTANTPEEANAVIRSTTTWTKEQREPLIRAIHRRLQEINNPKPAEQPSILVRIRMAKDLTELDAIEIDVAALDAIIQPDMMAHIEKRRAQLNSASLNGV